MEGELRAEAWTEVRRAQELHWSPLLLCLRRLAVRGVASLQYLHLLSIHDSLSPFVVEHLPALPSLVNLDLAGNEQLQRHSFVCLARSCPALASLTLPSCLEENHLLPSQLPQLEELCFAEYVMHGDGLRGE